MMRTIQHDASVETRILGLDHQPYSHTHLGVPDDVLQAAREGLCVNLPEIDCRQIEWEPIDV